MHQRHWKPQHNNQKRKDSYFLPLEDFIASSWVDPISLLFFSMAVVGRRNWNAALT